MRKRYGRRMIALMTGAVLLGSTLCGTAVFAETAESAAEEAAVEAPAAEETAAEEPAAEGAAVEAPAAEETAAEEPAAGKTGAAESIQVYVGTNSDRYWSDDDTSRLLVESEWPALALDSDCEANYPGLAAAFREENQATEETARETFQQYKEGIDEFLKDNPDSEVSYSELQECYVVRADADYVSFLDIIAGYAGGAHGYYGYKGVTLRPGTGETVKLSDLVADGPAFLAEVRKTVEEEYPDVDPKLCDSYFAETDLDEMTYVTGVSGITCVFAPYNLGPYAIGTQKVEIPYAGNEALFKEDFTSGAAAYGVEFAMYEPMTIGGHEITITAEQIGEYGDIDSLSVFVDGEETKFDDVYGSVPRPTWIHVPEADYIYFDLPEDSDYHELVIVRIGDKAEKVGVAGFGRGYVLGSEEDGWNVAAAALTDPTQMPLYTRTFLLSTLNGEQTFSVGPDGMPVPSEDYYVFAMPHTLTLKTALKAVSVTAEGEEQGEVTLPKGTELTMVRTDNDSWVDMIYGEMQYVRVRIDEEKWPQTIGGKDIEDIFDNTVFAG